VHYDWLEAGEHTQRTVAQLSQQLRRFLDDRAWLENRRIMDILHGVEASALALRDTPPPGDTMEVAGFSARIELPMERPLYTPVQKPRIADIELETDDAELDAAALYSQIVIDRARLASHVRQALQERAQITLRELTEMYPLEHGLAELVTYLQLASDVFDSVVDESVIDEVVWHPDNHDHTGVLATRRARFPRVIFVR